MAGVDRIDRIDRIDKVERIGDLLAYLLHTPRPAHLYEILREVPGYPQGEQASRQAFERDKRILRDEGIAVTVEHDDDGPGYRIRPEDYYLPDLGLSAEETLALNLAATAVRLGGAGGEEALWKLGGVAAPAEPLVDLPSSPTLPALREAVRRRARVRLRYHGRNRTLEPVGLLFRDGFWYVNARDEGQELVKNFRVDRIEGDVEVGEPAAFSPPEGFDPSAALPTEPWQLGGEEAVRAEVLVDRVHAARVEAELGAAAVIERRADGGIVVGLDVAHRPALRSWVLGMLDHARVLRPPELVDDMVSWLRAVAGPSPAGGP